MIEPRAPKVTQPAEGTNGRRLRAGAGRRAPAGPRAASTVPIGEEALWYKDAIIYEVHVRAFRDSTADGRGDFRGLTEKLDYFRDLGVTAIWVLPFYPSPLKDDGYDIADYTSVHPDYGTLRDVRQFIREAHKRGLRVITELVCNHTSDQHPWFQRARRARRGSTYRDFYVWSDTPDRYQDARIIFKDFETSNWTWDAVAGQYYWHRFYSHQPDLNFDNPKVKDAVFRAMDFWLEMGVDGLRLDAIPYLYEREGTDCENLPETHAFLKELRARIDARYPGRMLLAEANQWPEDSVEYFGDGDECHMAFHFPVMPRMFMAVRMEDRFPIIDILEQTPPIPDTAQWALFLRNHDELTLEMVTDEERDYMYRVYAHDPQMRINLGIRRRLAPLLGNHRRRIELLNGLLFSLPGTPVIYYGDEIGMGDNVYVGDRNGVRTPMQWSGNRNAGFSEANRQQLYLPVITDPEYHYEAINVDVQQGNPHSLLWWMKRLIDLRKRHAAFSRGTLEFLHPENRRILAFIRRHGDETLLVVANLSRYVQHVELDLSAFAGRIPTEMFGRVEFPVAGDRPYGLTLHPHAFLWFSLEPASDAPGGAAPSPSDLPVLAPVGSIEELARGSHAERLGKVLVPWIQARRWYRGKARRIRGSRIIDTIPVPLAEGRALSILFEIDYTDGDPETYHVPVAQLEPAVARALLADTPHGGIARFRGTDARADSALLVDATLVPEFGSALLRIVGERRRVRGTSGELIGRPAKAFRALRGRGENAITATPITSEQSNSSVVLGERMILKLYRAVEAGLNPDLEIGRFLSDREFTHVPMVGGAIEYRGPDGTTSAAAILQQFVPNEGDVWQYTLDTMPNYFERAVANREPPPRLPVSASALVAASHAEPDGIARDTVDAYLETAELLGIRTGELHSVLASESDDRAFAPEPFSELYQRSVFQSILGTVRGALRLLERQRGSLGEAAAADAERVLELSGEVDRRLRALLAGKLGGMRIRNHGDFHMGQVLHTGRDLIIIDFEGEPTRPLGERRLKRSPLRDVAGMLRSFHYAVHGSVLRSELGASIRREDEAALAPWVRAWYHWVSAAYLYGYRQAVTDATFLPADDGEWAILLDAFLLHKAFYEVSYELGNRPDWVSIPLRGIVELLDT
ncbi:MAG TPA: maltose alpha-D-glucosyltransferase [Vitreimonas sp.]|nr:maltose alpha-D-glucosyltransferase [Vitreimonas sp.]